MLEKPDIPDERIIACLRSDYQVAIKHLAFLPLGGDLSTAVYRAVAGDGRPYFCKLKRGDFDEVSVELPRFLSEQGYVNRTAEQEETLFYRRYGDARIDPLALAYYRYERNITDICVESTRILSGALGSQDRAQSLQVLTWLFMPGGPVELAYLSDRTR